MGRSSPNDKLLLVQALRKRAYVFAVTGDGTNDALLYMRDPNAFAYAIKRSCENKVEVVSQDEREGGLRATLNLGSSAGH